MKEEFKAGAEAKFNRFKDVDHGMGVYMTRVDEPTPFRRYWVDKQVLPPTSPGDTLVVADLGSGNGARGGAVLMELLRQGRGVEAQLLDMESGPLREAMTVVLPGALSVLGGKPVVQHEHGLRHEIPHPHAHGLSFQATAQLGRVTDLPFKTGGVDALMCELVLHWLSDAAQVRQALGEIARVLKPGTGTALLSVLTPWNRNNIRMPGEDTDTRWEQVRAHLAQHPGEPFPGTFPNPRGARLPLLYYPEPLFRDEVQRAGLEVTALELLGADLFRYPEERTGHPGSVWLTARKPPSGPRQPAH
jgi:SAM-dependent methyltransferase